MGNNNRGFKQRTTCEKQNFGRGHRGAVRPRLRNHHVHAQRYVRPRDRDRARASRASDVKYFPASSCPAFVSIPPSAAVDAPRGNGWMGDVATHAHAPGVNHSFGTHVDDAREGGKTRAVGEDGCARFIACMGRRAWSAGRLSAAWVDGYVALDGMRP